MKSKYLLVVFAIFGLSFVRNLDAGSITIRSVGMVVATINSQTGEGHTNCDGTSGECVGVIEY